MPPRKKKAAPGSTGLTVAEVASSTQPAAIAHLRERIEGDGGQVIGAYRDPYGGHWIVFAALPIEQVAPTPYQRELSPTHVKQLTTVVPKVGRYLDPIIAVPQAKGYWTPNGMHRHAALTALGAKAITALVVPEREIALRILALNTEKAHNLRDKSLEVMRMERDLASMKETATEPETTWAFEFEEPAYLTIGLCYEQRPRFAGAVYQPVLKRCEELLELPLPKAIAERTERAKRVLELDDAVTKVVDGLKAAGLRSPYLKAFVMARINPLRFEKAARVGGKAPRASFDATFGRMLQKAQGFDVSKVRQQDLAAVGGAPADE
jgi:ParB family chromosome partitioning protein